MIRQNIIITLFMFLGCILPGLVIIPAQYFGVNPSDLQGAGFKVTIGTVVTALLFSVISIAFVYLVQRYYHRTPSFLKLGFKREWIRGLMWGQLIGAATIAFPFILLLSLAENVQISSAVPESVDTLTLAGYYCFFLFMLMLNSFKEELLFRSYPIENLREKSAGTWAIILSASVSFSLVHHILEPFTWTAFLSRFLFGVFTCQVYMVTRSLWPVVGIHNGTNWFVITFNDLGNWKMGGLLLVTTGVENEPFKLDTVYSLVSRGVAIAIMYVWMRRQKERLAHSEVSID